MPTNPTQQETRRILTDCGALITDDHFVYSCGNHGAGWIAKDLVNLDPHHPLRLGELLASACADLNPRPQVVCGPALGGLICAQVTALAMNLPFVFAERAWQGGNQSFELHRGFDEFVNGKRVLVVDDVINTGFSIDLTIDSVRAAGGTVAAAGPGSIAATCMLTNWGWRRLSSWTKFNYRPGRLKGVRCAKPMFRSIRVTPTERNLLPQGSNFSSARNRPII